MTITAEAAAIRLVTIRSLIASRYFCFNKESDLHEGIESLLDSSKIRFDREFRLDENDRPDFFLQSKRLGSLVVEVKIHDALAKVTRQLHRYAQHESVDAILLVTTRHTHRDIPEQINGKPVSVLLLGGYGL